ncbi:MAG TPA: methylenetetrahydrofolate reductase [Desulfosarcina sp.]|nr:methylenetetrahydrofolate reductase [Desulfosarcina sp.]
MFGQPFVVTIEVVPPGGPDPTPLLSALESLAGLPFHGFSVATNPVARPRMSAMALSCLIHRRTAKPAILHLTTRDHNRLSLQGELWGAGALGIETVLVATGDFVAFEERQHTTTVGDVDVYDLVRMARDSGMRTGVVFDGFPESDGMDRAVAHLKRKVDAGAQFAVTQPVYDEAGADRLARATRGIAIPLLLGVLPLRTPRHAEFLHNKVAGITVPEKVRQRMRAAVDPPSEGAANARRMIAAARQRFAGVCIMPPFDRYEILCNLL